MLYRDFGPADLVPRLEARGITQTVLVQAAPTVDETRYLLGLADRTPWVGAVVGWVPLDEPDAALRALDELAAHPTLRGIRPMIQDLPDASWMLGEALTPGFERLIAAGLRFDALVKPPHLPHLLRLLERHPELRVVIDHGAKPDIAAGAFAAWAEPIARLARETGAVCKLSGLATEAGPDWSTADLRPFVDHLLACFGPDRLMWGSDWPVVELAGGFDPWWNATDTLLAELDETQRGAILEGTARRFYALDEKGDAT